MEFCTAVNCMDGRTQEPVIEYLKGRFGAVHIDMITEPGPNLILAEQKDQQLVHSILARVDISVSKHGSAGIAIVGHHDCAGNPAEKEDQLDHLMKSMTYLKSLYPKIEVIAVWIDENWQVSELV